jgi:hypothetical protein
MGSVEQNRLARPPASEFLEARRHPRYKVEIEIRVYARGKSVVHGHTVDISESGISAILRDEIPLGEVVRLEFLVSAGLVDVHALVRQRSAFRYGFQFIEESTMKDIIGRTCRDLSVAHTISKEFLR